MEHSQEFLTKLLVYHAFFQTITRNHALRCFSIEKTCNFQNKSHVEAFNENLANTTGLNNEALLLNH